MVTTAQEKQKLEGEEICCVLRKKDVFLIVMAVNTMLEVLSSVSSLQNSQEVNKFVDAKRSIYGVLRKGML